MAIIYDATLTPTKGELLTAWLDRQPWGGSGPVEQIGSYRFDDPDGEVGLEGFILRRDGRILHVPVTCRGAPLPEAEESLVGTLDHSVLGERWVYDALGDPLGREMVLRALDGRQDQARLDMYTEDRQFIETVENTVLVSAQPPSGELRDQELIAVHKPETEAPSAGRSIVASWPGGEGVLFHG